MSKQTMNLPDNPQIEVIKSGKTGLFTNYIYKAIPLAFDESMSYYECLCGLLDYLKNTIIPTVNNNADAVAELQDLYVVLKNYVANYFDNLDVQEEINNKLDKMAEDGTLEKIIEKYVGTYTPRIFNNVESLKKEDLQDGNYAETIGYYNINDGGGAMYKITSTQPEVGYYETLNNGNYAILLFNDFVYIEQLGAKGSETEDESDILQTALNLTNVRFKNKRTYTINKTIIINNSLDANDSTFKIPDFDNLKNRKSLGVFLISKNNLLIKNCNFESVYTDYTQKIPYTTSKILPPILSFVDGSDNSKAENCNVKNTNGHTIQVYGNTVKNIIIENCTAIDGGCGVGIEQISGSDITPKNITINNFYSQCNNSCEITSGSGICVNNCYFESNGDGKAVFTTNEAYHDTHIDINGCTFTHTGIGANDAQSRCILIDSYESVKKMYVNLTSCIINGDIDGVRAIYTSSLVKLSLISCDIKGRIHIINGSYLDIINCSLENKVSTGNTIVINNKDSYCSITNSNISITSPGASIWTQGNLNITNCDINSDSTSITYKETSRGIILNSTISKLDTSANKYGVTCINTSLTNDSRFFTNVGTIKGTVANATDLANITEISNTDMILVTSTKKLAYKYGNQWFYVDGTFIS